MIKHKKTQTVEKVKGTIEARKGLSYILLKLKLLFKRGK